MNINKGKKVAIITVDGEEIERANSFEDLEAKIEVNGKKPSEICRR